MVVSLNLVQTFCLDRGASNLRSRLNLKTHQELRVREEGVMSIYIKLEVIFNGTQVKNGFTVELHLLSV